MTTLLLSAGGVLVALFVAYIKGRTSGAAREKAKRQAEEAKARDIRDQVQNDTGMLSDAEARRRLGEWSR